ncbi:OTOG protein, partial [Mesembrinibis cayennensis]|nr:OTOG protein [Mesembrinibis cayennensis]
SESFTCFNGGECVYRDLCNCSRFNATGPRCQTVYNTGAERDHICRTWGQYNFETFDGLYYYFSGKSTYVLVRHTELEEQSFSIQVNNDPECHSSPYSCKRSISLFFSGDEQIKMSSEVTYKGFGVQLPYIIGNLHIQKLAGYFLVRHQYAFTLAWDGTSAVYIKMAPEYLGKTHGLCGNNNAILQDDLETSYGKLTDDVTEFVESWQENPPEGTPNWDKSLLNEPPCLTQSHESLQRAYILCNILSHPPFEQCHEYVSPVPFMASCTNDLCMSAVDNATWCRALTEYARACAQAGKPLHGWRMHFQQCVITCAEPLTYSECINCCPVSCHQQSQCIDSELPCIDGCYCPDGLIYENELCVKPVDCPCDYQGSFFEIGSVVYEECNNCTCIGGKWICTNLTCPAECSVSGDIHFMTFDGRKYTFQATCQYILAKSRTSGAFTITLQNTPCGQNQDGSCIQSISLILKQDPKRQVTLTHSGDVLVYDQYKINLPYADELFEIRKLSSVFLQVKTHLGLQILYDRKGLRLYLQADGRWKDDTVGLCGTFNGNTEDDFLSPVGVTESTPELFGNTWKTSSACILMHDSSQMDPCDIHLQAASYAAEACSILMKELFAPCYPYLSPVPYFEQCRRDTCKCGHICFCSALAHYAHHCRRFGVVIDFRGGVPDCALSCEDTKEYSTCVSTCGRTCQALSVPETCSSDCVEGCACPSGMYLNSKTERCVQRNECPCYFQGIDYPPGENVMTSLGKCHCRDGVMNCDNNLIAHSCPVGQIYINCSNPQVDPELSRERTCENQLLNLTFSAHLPCVSGCVCPPGLVKHGDVCLEADECPCSWKGKEYFPGDKVISSCHTCVCQHGSFQCTFHPCPSMCTAYGDRHYRTFDGLTFDFVGTCKVYLVKGTSSTSVSIIIENINCFNTGIICRKSIFINVGKSFLIFDDETGNPSLSSHIDELQKVQLWKAGFFTVVHFPDEHITVLWDQRTTVHVQMGHQWQGELTGLCGNFDLKTVNELRTPDNFELTNSQEFGNSWTAVECVDSSDIRNPCSLNPLREPFAKKECGILLSEAFEACHPVIDVTWFYSNCLTDTCGCNQGGDCECFCTSVSAYAHQCCQHGVAVDWRSPRVCPYDCEYFNKALGKGPYKLVSYLDGGFIMAVKLVDGVVFPVREEDIVPGHAVSFMLTSGLYKPKAHDSNLISFETAERPNYFLQLTSNNSLVPSKWEKSEEFHNRSTYVIHKNTWLSGYSSFESFAKPGYFIHISASSVELLKYHHSEEFRLSTLFKLVDPCFSDVKFKFPSRSACEWHYDACTSPCFKTCRDPLGKNCQAVPKVEGCIPACPLNMLLDEITQRCVYFEDCMFEKLYILWKTEFSAVTSNTTLPAVTLSSNVSSQSAEMTSGRSTTAMSRTTKSNVSLSSPVDISPLFPSTISSETSIKIQPISSGSTKLLRATEPQTVTATHAVTTSTESESKPISTFIFTGTPLILRTTEIPLKTKIMEISAIATLPTKEAQGKPEGLTKFTPSSFESITEKTTAYLPQFSTSPPLGMPSYTPPVKLTGTSEGTKISIGQSFTPVANVTVTSFSPVITTVSLLKPVSSATTKAAIVSTEQSVKTTFSATSTPPISFGKAITEPPIEMVQDLTGTAEVPFTTTPGPKTTTLQTQERSSETTFTTEATVELTSSYPLITSLPEGIYSSILPTSAGPPQVILPTERELHLTDSVTQPYVSRTSVLQSTVPTRTTAGLIFGTSVLPSSAEVHAASSPLAAIKKETFPSFSTQKTGTGLKFTWQALFTESLDSSQTLGTTTSSPESKSTSSSVLLPETTEIPIMMSSEPSTSMGKSGTEETSVLPKQVTLSTTPSSSTFLASTMLSATARSSAAALVSSTISKTPQIFYSPYFTNTTAVPSDVSVSVLSTIHSSSEPKPFSSVAASSVSTTQTSKLEISFEVQTPSVSSLLTIADHPNDTTAAPSVSSFAYLSTKPLYSLTTTSSDGLATAETMSSVTASAFMLPRETATLQTCTPITENECIKHICLDGQLIQVNKSQNCPYNATQPSCGVLGFATQMNGDKCCPKWECACRCTIFSDLSIVTYDGNHLALFKEASYVVSQTQDETITIHVLDCRMSNSNSTSLCLAMLNLTYVSNQIIINRLSRKITVNSRYAWPTVRKYGYKVEDSGFKYAVETPTKIRIQWFHNTGVMIIEFNSTREPRALGLCGFCDRSLENDLMLPNRTVLSKSDAPSTFIDSWQVPDTLKYVGEDRHQETNCSVMDCSECLRLVLNQTFSSCHPYVPPELFCNIWVQDTEYIRNPCISLAAYVAMCNKFNICIEWRSSDYCPFPCSENFSYQACIAACQVADSCQNNEVASLDSDSCSVLTEGCVCAGGTILHRAHTAVCIPEEKCACTDSSGAPRAVGEIWTTSLSGCCMQKCVDSETIIPVEYNCSDIHNLECQRFAEVALLVPGDQTCCPQKICICNQSLCEPLIPECSGLEKLVTYYSEESCCPNYVCECDPAKCAPVEQMPRCRDDQTLIAARVESTCCISYICACGACSDQIPKCQEGEVLIVDGNTTERCCPTYQCICEIHRCPEFKCMLGMSLVEVWSPEKCCPFRTCECACETIPKPQCKLGQKLQIDEQFQNSTENICNCVKYKCVRDKVCLSNDRAVLLPGQTIVEHSADGICRISYCTNVIDPSTKYYRINTSSIDCAVKCNANQVYQPPKDLTTCCGSCKNLSCLHAFSNGTVSNFKPGTVWISNCIRYECTNTAIGPVLVSSSVGCPPFNETECVKVGGYVVPFLEGCCKTCKEDGKFCKKVTVRMTIRKNDCRSNTPVNIVSCDGKCPSASIYNYNINTYARFCKCCRELGLQRRTVQLYCTSNSTWVSYSIQEPTDCSCQWS